MNFIVLVIMLILSGHCFRKQSVKYLLLRLGLWIFSSIVFIFKFLDFLFEFRQSFDLWSNFMLFEMIHCIQLKPIVNQKSDLLIRLKLGIPWFQIIWTQFAKTLTFRVKQVRWWWDQLVFDVPLKAEGDKLLRMISLVAGVTDYGRAEDLSGWMFSIVLFTSDKNIV